MTPPLGQEQGLWRQMFPTLNPAATNLQRDGQVSQSLYLSESPFPHVKNGDNIFPEVSSQAVAKIKKEVHSRCSTGISFL